MGFEVTIRANVDDGVASSAQVCARTLPMLLYARPIVGYSALLLWCVCSTGCCRLWNLAYRTTRYEPGLYCAGCDETDSLALYSSWADEAWIKETGGCAEPVALPDYGLGFHAGFVDYCYAGGTGEPPPMPPRIYWNIEGRVADGKAAARAWFDGYRHGARLAREGGYRESAVVQSSTAVHHSREESYRAEMTQNDEFGPAFVNPTTESLPTPGARPRNDEPSSDQPEALPRGALPELTSPATTQPATGSPADGASIKSRDRRVKPASFIAMADAKKPRAAGKSGSAKERVGQLSNQNVQVQRDRNTKAAVTATVRKSSDTPSPNDQATPNGSRDEVFQNASIKESEFVPHADSATKTQSNRDADVSTPTSLQAENNHTTLVFKNAPN